MSSVNEMTVTMTKIQVLDLLKSCLLSKTTLTDFFLENKLLLRRSKIVVPLCDPNANGIRKIKVKIMQRKSDGKIVFAQGKEEFADFLLSFLTFPLGGVLHLMKGCSFMGRVDELYKSIVHLDEDYWTIKEAKNKLVNPGIAPQFTLSNQLLPIYYHGPKYFCYYKYVDFKMYLTEFDLTSKSRYRNNNVSRPTALNFDPTSETGNGKGYVKGPTMYMATDDLVVTPMSTISVVSLLNRMNIPFCDLKEKEIYIGMEEGVRILQASLTSTSALTIGLSHLLNQIKEELN